MNEAIIVDIDGTIADRDDRGIWDYHLVGQDLPKPNIIRIIKALQVTEDVKVIYVTGRPERCSVDTLDWLQRHALPVDSLFMRNNDDRGHDYDIKRDIYLKQIKPFYHVIAVFEDRTRNVNMWRELGLTCLQVAPGDF